jgi:hypothetical protein
MNEFNNRISAQRVILQIVNGNAKNREELFGLSKHAIDRWVSVNRIDSESALVGLVRQSAEKLFFLANKSQDTVSQEYQLILDEIASIVKRIEAELVRVGKICHGPNGAVRPDYRSDLR